MTPILPPPLSYAGLRIAGGNLMVRQPVPSIRREHYNAFLRIRTLRIPDRIAQWDRERADDLARIRRSGHIAVLVEINPDEFAAFCRERGCPADFDAMQALVVEKFRGQGNARTEAGIPGAR